MHNHQFHIPVMGTSFTIDSPLRVGRFGIDSVVSIGDDALCESMRAHWSAAENIPFQPIEKWSPDYRARRITAYLNLIQTILDNQIAKLKQQSFSADSDLCRYFEMLPNSHPVKPIYITMKTMAPGAAQTEIQDQLRAAISPGSIDVNIMTKIDRITYDKNGAQLGELYSDALSAFRGFAQSRISGAVVLSAGFNRRLYGYIPQFPDFFPDEQGNLRKRIILKVSDFRSSLTQGKFLAKKGIWIYEHRIESGLNCGGHAFATTGELLGPIMAEFKSGRDELKSMLRTICNQSLAGQNRPLIPASIPMRITVQGGLGTAAEHAMVRRLYEMDGTGWATPFLLVAEATLLDVPTRERLREAGKPDLFLSDVSPLGVPFNTIRSSISEEKKWEKAYSDRPGSPCPKGHLVSNTEFTAKPICTASTTYQKRKIDQLKSLGLSQTDFDSQYKKIVEKACLCEDLAASALAANNIDIDRPLSPAVCPGPNLAYFSRLMSLSEMVGHIYGKNNCLNTTRRPHMFVNECELYIQYFAREIEKIGPHPTKIQLSYLADFKTNLLNGIAYYREIIPQFTEESDQSHRQMQVDFHQLEAQLQTIVAAHPNLFQPQPAAALGPT